ncbi:hypothetical protein BDW22DRAFT_873964 [Trametopsis cervina]|nr:hypothetical protein BDW22DRAFT_873964 [Trametopsis cervina]
MRCAICLRSTLGLPGLSRRHEALRSAWPPSMPPPWNPTPTNTQYARVLFWMDSIDLPFFYMHAYGMTPHLIAATITFL